MKILFFTFGYLWKTYANLFCQKILEQIFFKGTHKISNEDSNDRMKFGTIYYYFQFLCSGFIRLIMNMFQMLANIVLI